MAMAKKMAMEKPTSPEISIYHDPHYFSYQYCTVQKQELGQAILKLIRIIKKQGPGRFGEHGMFHRIFTVTFLLFLAPARRGRSVGSNPAWPILPCRAIINHYLI